MTDSNEIEIDVELDQALAEYLTNVDSGQSPDRQAFLNKYSPALRDKLAALLAAADWIEQQAGPSLGTLQQQASQISFLESGSDQGPQLETLPVFAGQSNSRSHGRREFSQPELPCRFGDYELLRVIGRGGMGVVYYGRQIDLDRPVAIKMLRSGVLASDEEVQRFYVEARSAAKLSHPRIVTVHQCGEHAGHHYFSMDFVEGTDLDKLSKEKPMDGGAAARYVRDAALAIQFAHDHGIVHRDLKPANVLVDKNDQIRLTDFGLAKIVGKETGLTATGAALGTPSFMSPEQAAGQTGIQNEATDVYSLGAVLYAILTGQPPFRAENALQTLMQVIHRPAPRLRALRPDLSKDLETIVEICLNKAPQQRYPSASALADDLDRTLKRLPISARPIPAWRRYWSWLLGVPIIGAVLDNRVVEPTPTHRWVQRGIFSTICLMVMAWLLQLVPESVWFKERMPQVIRVASGLEGGDYSSVASVLAKAVSDYSGKQVELLSTQGSTENIEKLGAGLVHLALLQADVVGDSNVAVVAPLYYEVVHVLVRTGSEIKELADLENRRVYVGQAKAGSRVTAKRLLKYCGVDVQEMALVDKLTGGLTVDTTFDAAILVSRMGSPDVLAALQSGQFRMLDIPQAWQFALAEPTFHPIQLSSKEYPASLKSEATVRTVATTAYLVCDQQAPDIMVSNVLQSLYSPAVSAVGILTAEQAAHWQGIAWHPAARKFFQAYRGGDKL